MNGEFNSDINSAYFNGNYDESFEADSCREVYDDEGDYEFSCDKCHEPCCKKKIVDGVCIFCIREVRHAADMAWECEVAAK